MMLRPTADEGARLYVCTLCERCVCWHSAVSGSGTCISKSACAHLIAQQLPEI